MTRRAVPLAVLAAALSACSASTRKTAGEMAETVFTLQTGTMSELKDRWGSGPFRDYDVPPDEMVPLVGAVLRTKVVAVAEEPRFRRVFAKERAGKDAADDFYGPAFRSAVAVFVHPVDDAPGRCRVEVHAVQRGPFHRGSIDWEREVPPLLDEAVRRRGTTPIRPLR
ncbi:MAG: hypothetical protein IT460_16015 [Planctomycetes bacterium]|nr:hypothetical protein [Planctomycetota bacterium]